MRAARRAFDRAARPGILRSPNRPPDIAPAAVEAAFLGVNPGWTPDMPTITCREERIQEARLCRSKELKPMRCRPGTVADCSLSAARMPPVR